MSNSESNVMCIARKIAKAFGELNDVEAVALGGSQANGPVDAESDIDIYVYTTAPIDLADREAIADDLGAVQRELNQTFWDVADGWVDAETNIEIEAVYWDKSWIERKLDRVLIKHLPSNGYSTAHWHTIRNSVCLYDKDGWFAALQHRSRQPYPEQLREAIVAWNHQILSKISASFLNQIKKAVKRNDLVSVNHRLTELLAGYFDIIFALNRIPHPGEKRLLEQAAKLCPKLPKNMEPQVKLVLQAAAKADDGLIATIDKLMDDLDSLLIKEGFNEAS